MLALAFALLSLLLRCSVAEEPTCACSKFHYEEQMLEKMVRMEFSVERMKHDMIEAKQALDKTLEEFKTLKVEYRKNVDNYASDLRKLKDSLVTPTIAFKAKKVINQSPQINEVIVFTETMFNYGEHYHNATGVFTAPVEGTYLFTIQFCLLTQRVVFYGIMVEGERITNGMFYEYNNYACNTADSIVVLKPGNRVWVQYLRQSSIGGATIEGNNDYRWNTFSGTLLHM